MKKYSILIAVLAAVALVLAAANMEANTEEKNEETVASLAVQSQSSEVQEDKVKITMIVVEKGKEDEAKTEVSYHPAGSDCKLSDLYDLSTMESGDRITVHYPSPYYVNTEDLTYTFTKEQAEARGDLQLCGDHIIEVVIAEDSKLKQYIKKILDEEQTLTKQ